MHKPSVSRLGIIASIAMASGLKETFDFNKHSTAEFFRNIRGKTPKGKRWNGGVYIPGGSRSNVAGCPAPRNPKIGAQVNAMHEKWWAAKLAREGARA